MYTFVTGGSGFVGRHLIRYLREHGHPVRALARSASAEAAVRGAGAESVQGDLDDVAALTRALSGIDCVFHAAAFTGEWAPWEESYRANVKGTENLLAAAKAAGVRKFVHVSTEAVLLGTGPLIDTDETRPLPDGPIGHYAKSKGLAEQSVVAAAKEGLDATIIRPRLIWGPEDTSVLPKIVEAVKTGRFKWIDGGRALTSTCHVRNVCEGALLAAQKGRAGEVYFLTDGAPITTREFLSRLMRTQGVEPPTSSVPFSLANAMSVVVEGIWTALGVKSVPPATRTAVLLMGQQMTVNDAKARRELGYTSHVSREAGLAELEASPAARRSA